MDEIKRTEIEEKNQGAPPNRTISVLNAIEESPWIRKTTKDTCHAQGSFERK